MQLAHTVDGIAHGHAQVRHVHHAVGNHRHVTDALPLAGEVIPQPRAQPAVDLLQNLINAGQQLPHHFFRPLLQRFRHDGVVCVGHRLLHNGGSFVPAKALFVHQDTHHFRNSKPRVRIVDVDAHLLRQQLEVAPVQFFEILDDVLQRGACEEIVLLEPQHLAFVVVVLRIQHLGDDLRCFRRLHRLAVLALTKRRQVNVLGAAGRPHAKRVHRRRIIAYNRHVVRDGLHRVVIPVDKARHTVVVHLVHMAAEVNLAGVLHHGHFPHVAVGQPAVWQFHLLTIHNFLAEQAVFIANRAAHRRQIQAGQAVQEACRQASEAAVAQARFRLFLQQVVHIDAQFAQRLPVYIRGHQVQHVAIQAAPHQKFYRQIIQPLELGFLALLTGNGVLLHNLVAHGGSKCLIDLLGGRLLNAAPIVALQFANDGCLDGFFIK